MTDALIELFEGLEANAARRIPRRGNSRNEKDTWGAAYPDIGSAVRAIVAISIGAGGDMEHCLTDGTAGQQRAAQERLHELEALEVHAAGDMIVLA